MPRWLPTAFVVVSLVLMTSLWGMLLVQRELIREMRNHVSLLEERLLDAR